MNKEDARELSPSVQEGKGKLALNLWKKGLPQKIVAKMVSITPGRPGQSGYR